ncbi:hypothetical protein PVAP13_4KG164615 [Panicum virgatum]|uniref:Uncharacterized protein n=1 Tax=Panicum virgatum TaxID=38727 RepID=A0A8T0TNZ2_PANVG|nr:hypothetical protein PVAP13_4KG164615 [Panicum virgatum]
MLHVTSVMCCIKHLHSQYCRFAVAGGGQCAALVTGAKRTISMVLYGLDRDPNCAANT